MKPSCEDWVTNVASFKEESCISFRLSGNRKPILFIATFFSFLSINVLNVSEATGTAALVFALANFQL